MSVEKVGQDEKQKLRATCARCGAMLEFYDIDVKISSGYSMGELEVRRYVECPQCKACVNVKE